MPAPTLNISSMRSSRGANSSYHQPVHVTPYDDLILHILITVRKRAHKRFLVGTLLLQPFTRCTHRLLAGTARLFASTGITCLSRPFDALWHDARRLGRRAVVSNRRHL
jgi:hypothetical protein